MEEESAIYGEVDTEKCWRRRRTEELENLYEEPKIPSVARAQRFTWLGYVQRLGKNRMPRMTLSEKAVRKKGRADLGKYGLTASFSERWMLRTG